MSKFQPEGLYLTAQEYKLRHRFRPTAIGRWLAEKVFSQFGDRMEVLAVIDQQIRETALGKNEFNISIKDALGKAKESYRAGRYVDVMYYASVIDEIVIAIALQSQEVISHLRGLGPEYSARTETPEAVEFFENRKQVEAQMLQNIWREFAGDPMERAYQEETRKQKITFGNFIVNIERYTTELMGIFDRLGMARSGGKIENWVSEYDRLINSQPKYHAYIDRVYDTDVKSLVEVAKRLKKDKEIGSQNSFVWLENIFGGTSPSKATPPPLPQQSEEEVINVEESDIVEDEEETDPWGLSPASQQAQDAQRQEQLHQSTPAGQPTQGVPVSPGVAQQPSAPEAQAEPAAPRRGRGRPRKEPGTAGGITDEQLSNLQEILQSVRKEQAQIMAEIIETVLRAGGGDEIIQSADGEVIAQVQNGVITFYGIEGPNGKDIQISVSMAFKALRQMEIAGLLGAKPAQTYRRGPEAKPIPMGGEVSEEEGEESPKLLGPVPSGKGVPAKPKAKRKPRTRKPRAVKPVKTTPAEPEAAETEEKPKKKPAPRKPKKQRRGLMVSIGDKNLMQKMRADPKAKSRFLEELRKLYLTQHPEVKEDFSVYIAPPDQVQKETDRYQKRGTYDDVVLDSVTYDDLTNAATAKVSMDNVDQAMLKVSNKLFYRALKQTAALNDPYLMATLMLKYSKKIEDADPALSIKLLAKAQEIING